MNGMRSVVCIWLLGHALLLCSVGANDVPQWNVGDRFINDVSLHITHSYQRASFDLTIDCNRGELLITSVEDRILPQCGSSFNLYLGEITNAITADGEMTIHDLSLTIPINIQNGVLVAEMGIKTDSLAWNLTAFDLLGEVWGYLFEQWSLIGMIYYRNETVFCPGFTEFLFPPRVGDRWFQDVELVGSSLISAQLEIFGVPWDLTDEYVFSDFLRINGEVLKQESMNGFTAWKILHQVAEKPPQEIVWVSPEMGWFTRKRIQDYVSPEGSFQLENLLWDVYPAETPPPATPTPSPGECEPGLALNQESYQAGDPFILDVCAYNSGQKIDLGMVVVLDLGAGFIPQYYFHPSWSSELDYEMVRLPEHNYFQRNILTFQLPDPLSPGGPFTFWAGFVQPEKMELWGDIYSVLFTFE